MKTQTKRFVFLSLGFLMASQQTIAQDFNKLFGEYEEQGLKAAIYISQKDGSHFHEDYLDKDNSIDENTIFGIASVNKAITAVTLFKLIEKGKLKLNDPLSKFFPEVPKDKKDITLKQLMDHTSGIADDFIMEGIQDEHAARKKLFEEKLLFKPGEIGKHQYSSDAYNLLAMVIEEVTDKKYEDYVRKVIFRPLKMNSSFFWEEVVGQDLGERTIAPITSPIPENWKSRNWGFVGSGGIFTNLEDLVKFSKAISSDKILNSASIAALMLSETILPSTSLGKLGIAHGAFVGYHEDKQIEFIATGSEDFGHNAIIRYFPGKDLTVAVLTASIIDGSKAGSKVISNAIVEQLIN